MDPGSVEGEGKEELVLDLRGGKGHPATELTVEGDLEGVETGTGQGDIEDQHSASLDIHHAGGRLAELDRSLAPQQLGAGVVDEPDPDGVDTNLGPPPAHPEHQVGARADGGELGEPHVLEDAQHAELALLVDQGVVGDQREVEMQLRTPGCC
jgi:hypothetical protein